MRCGGSREILDRGLCISYLTAHNASNAVFQVSTSGIGITVSAMRCNRTQLLLVSLRPSAFGNCLTAMHVHLALYGNIAIPRAYCSKCKIFALVRQEKLQCCDALFVEQPTRWKQIVAPAEIRRLPPLNARKTQLERQENRCLYCEREFGTYVFRNVRAIRLRTTWDHVVPFAYSQNNNDTNFVAACQICNGIKADHVFQDLDAARLYVTDKRRQREYI